MIIRFWCFYRGFVDILVIFSYLVFIMWEAKCVQGDLAQMVERLLSMQEALGSMPRFSIFLFFYLKTHKITIS